MVTVVCWIVLHSSNGPSDYRTYKSMRGVVLKELGDSLLVNFYENFKSRKINTDFNPTNQVISENDCLYE